MSGKISAMIVDDEPLGRDVVRHMLAAHPDLEIVGECGDGAKAVAAIKRLAPALVFLDIRMPKLDGMEVLARLEPATPGGRRPVIVFVTAYDEYAVRAFEERALDYLLKPFDQERFDATIHRVRERIQQLDEAELGKSVRGLLAGRSGNGATAPAPAAATVTPYVERLVVRESGRIFFVGVHEIDYLEAAGNYVSLHVAGKTHLIHETMTNTEARLDPARFVRIHRSTIVNVARIDELRPHFNGEYIILLKDATELKLSRGYVDKAKAALGLE
jgi:two-component system LytT family response regulator